MKGKQRTWQCERCKGLGGTSFSVCRACRGKGEFKTSPEQRERARKAKQARTSINNQHDNAHSGVYHIVFGNDPHPEPIIFRMRAEHNAGGRWSGMNIAMVRSMKGKVR